MNEVTNRIEAARKRFESETKTILANTQDIADKYGVRIGDTIMIRTVPEVGSRTSQDILDDFLYKDCLMRGYLNDN